ncbi:MAG: regulatory iron-sulfur-containing complex subunit RicT [Rikenellaceae bacterium]
MSCKCKNRPDIERGVVFCNCGSEPQAWEHKESYKHRESDWLREYPNNLPTDIIEVRFKNTRRSFYKNVHGLDLKVGDIVAVESSPGHDIGTISLMGDMVARQIKRTGFSPFNGEFKKIYRKAKPYDIEKWQEAIGLEHETMIASRQIAADMGLNMKIGDVEYQGDRIKAIFYYIADERVDFRELIKVFADKFHIRIEMKQIGARQEAGQIGGIGPCGRELCCSAWMSNFTSVTTNAARMQEISLNPQKLIGQCSKLKCCMMYEYDTYADARKEFPRLREPLQALDGEYYLIKNDILARTMSFSSSSDAIVNMITLPVSRVWEIINVNKQGKKVDQLQREEDIPKPSEEPKFCSTEDSITRFDSAKRPSRGRGGRDRKGGRDKGERRPNRANAAPADAPESTQAADKAATPENARAPRNAGNDRRRQNNNRRDNNAPRQKQAQGSERAQGAAPVAEKPTAPTEKREGGEKREGAPRRANNRNNRNLKPRPAEQGGGQNQNNGGERKAAPEAKKE